jgi:hypothetical protein
MKEKDDESLDLQVNGNRLDENNIEDDEFIFGNNRGKAGPGEAPKRIEVLKPTDPQSQYQYRKSYR